MTFKHVIKSNPGNLNFRVNGASYGFLEFSENGSEDRTMGVGIMELGIIKMYKY